MKANTINVAKCAKCDKWLSKNFEKSMENICSLLQFFKTDLVTVLLKSPFLPLSELSLDYEGSCALAFPIFYLTTSLYQDFFNK